MQPGTVLADRYRLDRAVGAGGMGQVWAAHDEVLGRTVAVKVQAMESGTSNELERFRREARAAAGLGHPNVVTIFDAGVGAGTAFLVMELLPGPDLATYVRSQGVLSESEAVAVAEQIAAGLAAAHAAGVVHRDIKPANVMFHAPGSVKIVDFGIARLAQTSAARLTATNTLVGSAPYLSPEQVEGRPADERSDIYALGCVLMTMLTGRPPFEGDHPLAVMHQHVSGAAPRISERRPEVSPALDELVSDMLAKAPEQRPATCEAVIARLRLNGAAGTLAATRRMADPAGVQPAGGEVDRPAWALPGRARSIRGLFAVVGAVLLVAVVAMVLLGRQNTEARTPVPTPSSTIVPQAGARPSSAPSSLQPAAVSSATTTVRGPQRLTQEAWTPAPSEPDLPQALARLQAVVDAALAEGDLDKKEAKELADRADELAEKLREDEGGDKDEDEGSARELDRTQRYLDELTSKGELSPDAGQRISAALADVRAAL